MAKRKDQSLHDTMVADLAAHLAKSGYTNIMADLKGKATPELMKWKGQTAGHIPDVTAAKDGKLHIFEVETDDSIGDQHTEDQWKLFSATAEVRKGYFYVLVPKASVSTAQVRAKLLSVTAQVWPYGD
jgi:hypothetical protein